MKQNLKKIYQDLLGGKLSQEVALEKIRELKLQEQSGGISTLLIAPVWKSEAIVEHNKQESVAYAQRNIILCGLPNFDEKLAESLISNCHCFSFQIPQEKNIAERYTDFSQACFELIKKTLTNKPSGKVLFQIVIANNFEEKLFVGLSGLLKTAAIENPQIMGQIILTPPNASSKEIVTYLQNDKANYKDIVIKYENGVRSVLGLQEIKTKETEPNIVFKDNGVYLITGGLGGLGLIFAKEIVKQTTNAVIILAERLELSAEKKKVLDSLSAKKNLIVYRHLDISDSNQVKDLISFITNEYKQLNGIIHCAGLNLDNYIIKKTSEEFSKVLLPKVNGTFNLDIASSEVELDFMVLFSSVASPFGNSGQADYTAANGFMDQFAVYRNSLVDSKKRKGKTLAINWPLWKEGGMKMDKGTEEMIAGHTGLRTLPTLTGIFSFYRGLELSNDQILVMNGNYSQIRSGLFGNETTKPEISDVVKKVEIIAEPSNIFEKAQDFLCKQLAGVLKIAAHQLDPHAPLEKYGIDSILSMNLTNQLEKTFGSLPKTLFFEYQTIHELTGYFTKSYPDTLAGLFTKQESGNIKPPQNIEASKSTTPVQVRQISGNRFTRQRQEIVTAKSSKINIDDDPIVIIGLSGRYPEAWDIQEYWRNLRDGKDCIIEVPKDRWDWRKYYTEDRTKEGHHFSKWGGFISGVDEFDPRFFNIAPREAEFIDPQERLFLQHAWMAVEDAGYTRDGLQLPHENDLAGQVGVYVGVMYGEYQLLGVHANLNGKRIGLVNSYSSIANRVSYFLNLHGPSMTLDTMCSSSLTAIHIACQDLKLGRTNLAIAGGVNISIHPNKYLFLSAGQFISADGRCQSFGVGGDGYIPGEGVGVVLLKRLSDAIKDGNHIYGVIKGSSLNHGGKTNGYSVPNPQAQAAVISRALAESGVNPRHISYIEAHGTGTKLGDPIEIAALNKAFGKFTEDTQFCSIGSAKSNIGHCESAAGIAGLTKVLLQLKYKQIVPSLHSNVLNPYIDFPKSPFIVNQNLKNWEQPIVDGQSLPRIAGVSSFGAGGSNAHIIIQEYLPTISESSVVVLPDTKSDCIIVLSARTANQLKQKASDLLEFIKTFETESQLKNPTSLNLSEIAYTLQVGREAMDERIGFLANSVEVLVKKLQAFINDKEVSGDFYKGQVKKDKDALSLFTNDKDLKQTIDNWFVEKQFSKLIELWVKGLELDWNKIYVESKPKFISLPTYPFARERYWVDINSTESEFEVGVANSVLHPLLHVNTSDLNQQSYSSTFSGKESFFDSTQINDQKVLKTAAYLEMARVAVENALPVDHESMTLELNNVVLGQPFVFNENTKLSIALFAKNSKQIDYEIYSQSAEDEIVHCQGQVIISPRIMLAKLDLDQIRRQGGQGSQWLLTDIELPVALQNNQSDFILHPNIIDNALNVSTNWVQGLVHASQKQYMLFALESIRIISSCSRSMIAWIRSSKDNKFDENIARLDIDFCDQSGNVCAEIRGLSYKLEEIREIPKVVTEKVDIQVKYQGPRLVPVVFKSSGKVSIGIPNLQSFEQVETKKVSNISLVAPDEFVSKKIDTNSKGKPSIKFSDSIFESTINESSIESSPKISLYDFGNGVFSIQINESKGGNTLSEIMIEHLLQVIDTVQKDTTAKVLIINGSKRTFLSGGRSQYNIAIEKRLFQAITSFSYPIIAAMQGDAIGTGFLIGALCDVMICSEEGKYYYSNNQDIYPSDKEDILFKQRFGEVCATDFLYTSGISSGSQLKAKGWNCPIVPQDQVEAYAQTIAQNLAKKSQTSLRLLKQHLGRHINEHVNNLTSVNPLVSVNESNIASKLDKTTVSTVKNLQLEMSAENILVVRMNSIEKPQGLKAVVSDLNTVFASINSTSQYKTVVLVIPEDLHLTGKQVSAEMILDFQQAIFGLNIPIIAVMDSNARGISWLMCQFCDACIYSEAGNYSVDNLLQYPELARQAAIIFSDKFGGHLGKEILLTAKEYSGLELQKRNGFLNITKKDLVLTSALKLAESWAKLPLDVLVSWKKQMALSFQEKLNKQPVWFESKNEIEKISDKVPSSVTLVSKVVSATTYPEGILVMKLEDRGAKNMFSDALVGGIVEVFKHIKENPVYKVLIITGFDNYFASGGTKETLLDIQKGKIKFTDTKIFHLAMECEIPVIAAMQGHGIGAGWSLGMFADFNIFGEESKYVSPYMSYGFTPGAGATLIFPEKVGYDIAREMLLTAQEYSGSDLKSRGIMMQVLPREKVLAAALDLAKTITNSSRDNLIALKHQFTHHILKRVEENYQRELDMHEKTFVGQSETLQMIQDNFGGGKQRTEKTQVENSAQTVNTVSSSSDNLSGVKFSINKLLAQELHLREDEIDENTQFVDLGLDSITGVTWVRKINEMYKTSIEATKIYSFPTLAQFSNFVKEEAAKNSPVIENKISITPPQTLTVTVPSVSDNFAEVKASINRLLAQELHLQEDEIDENTQFVDLGLDSITGVTWVRKINEKYKTSIEATRIYSFPTLAQFSRFVKDEAEKLGTLTKKVETVEVVKTGPQINVPLVSKNKVDFGFASQKLTSLRKKQSSRIVSSSSSIDRSQPIAIIGMAGQFPQSKNIEEFWNNIAQGKMCISQVPETRWDLNTYFREGSPQHGKTNCRWMGSLEEYDLFDPLFFNISPTEAESMDPQQRVLLQACWNSIEDAGYNPKTLSGSKCGVYIGCAGGDYHLLSRELQISAQGFTGVATSILAARISYLLNLQGPCLSIDTACSSSLVAIATACDSLVTGNSDLALAGGVYVMVGPDMHIKSSQTGMLSQDGRCYTFDNRANGFVPGEGVGVVMLKRLSDAERDNDIIYGVIQGWGINQDGKTNGITAPNDESQTRLEQDVYDRFRIDPNNIQLIEAHGTGTKLGDPIEVAALKKAFQKYTDKKEYCALGSVKSNIGHCLTAAGVASTIKVLFALKNRKLPPTVNFEKLNEHISLKDSPFYVNDKLQEWKINETESRQAAISAFGFSGTNAHIVVSEYKPKVIKQPTSVITQNSKIIVPLSARTEEQLKQKVRDLLSFIRNNEKSIDLVEMAYTLQVGREAMGERLCFMVSSMEQLVEQLKLVDQLQTFISGQKDIKDLYQGQVKRNKEGLSVINRDDDLKRTIIDTWIRQKKFSNLIDLWVKGIEFDWNKLYGEIKPQRINLPTYPFAKERYWYTEIESEQDKKTVAKLSVIHPLLHKNVSDLNQQRYSSVFRGNEVFINDYQIKESKVLSAFACVEMAREAIMQATATQNRSTGLEFCNLVWDKPVLVNNDKEVSIALFANEEKGHLNEQIDYEIFSTEAEQEVIHFQGQTFSRNQQELAKIDIAQLKEQMWKGTLEPNTIYAGFAKMGITYGLAHRGVATIYLGDNQLLAELSLPNSGEDYQSEFVLHPIIMESAIQACVCLITDINQPQNQPLLPHSLDSLSIISACTKDMAVWVHRKEVNASNNKLDVDIIDLKGNVCVQLKGLSLHQIIVETDNRENVQKSLNASEASYSYKTSQTQEASQQLFYQEYWLEQPLTSNVSLSENKQVIVFTDKEFHEKITRSDEANQLAKAIFIYQAEKYQKVSDNIYQCCFNKEGEIQNLFGQLNIEKNKPVTLIYSWAKDQKEIGVHALFNLFKAVKESTYKIVEVVLVGSYDPSSKDSCWDYSWIGFERSLKLDLPSLRISILYTDSSSYTPKQLMDSVQNGGVIWYNDKLRHVLSFKSCNPSKTEQKPILKKNGGYLITGGCGRLGLKFAHYLAKEYQAKLVLLDRGMLTPNIQEQIDKLKEAGAQEVHYQTVNISSKEAMTSFAQTLPFSLSGVIHTAGIESAQVFYEKSTESINQVLSPKTIGTILLDEMLEQQPLDFVCYFSSSAAFLGDFGACDYAIANRFQMAYAYYRQQKMKDNGKSVVINWPFWQEGGMGKGDQEQTAFYLKSSGQDALETSKGIEIWHDIIRSNQVQTLVMVGKPSRVEQFIQRTYEIEQKVEAPTITQVLPSHVGKGWRIQYQDLSLKQCVFSDLIKLVSASSKIPTDKLDGITNLSDYGFDSISLASFAKKLKDYFSLEITPALFFNYSTIEKLSDYFVTERQNHFQEFYTKPQSEKVEKKIDTAAEPVKIKSSLHKRFLSKTSHSRSYASNTKQEPIAIIGMSGRFPKADNVDQLWSLLEKGESGVSEIPLSRWDWRDYFTVPGDPNNKISTNKGGFINGVDEFDPLFFEISPREAEATDPGQRLLLMEAYKAIEDAQIDPSSLRGTSVGVFVGMEESQYDSLVSDEQGVGNSGNAMISSRLSYYLDLHGPTLAINTACSSGLVALHQAVMSLRHGECEAALAAGISSFILSPTFYIKMSQAGMLSENGECYSFAKKANGIGASEAVVVLMLKPLSAALAAGNPIYGTIKASGINFDGKTNGVTAPNGKMQEELIKNVYTNYSINPKDITHLVTHGTGTKLGDPIEINALNDAFKKLTRESQQESKQKTHCALTSCKSNLGHTMAASGLVSVVSLLKGLQHNKIPASIHCEEENNYITWEDSMFYINKTTKEWEKEVDKPRMGGVSAFGRSGTNAHVVIEEYQSSTKNQSPSSSGSSDNTSVIIPISAKTVEQLQQKVRDFLDFIKSKQSEKEPIELIDIAYSLQVSREIMDVRLGFIVNSIDHLEQKLQGYLNAEKDIEGVYQGEVKRYNTSVSMFNVDTDLQETIDKWIANKKLSKLLDLWVKGLALDWNKLYDDISPKCISLPKYPFAKERYWIEKTTTNQVTKTPSVTSTNYELIEDIINRVEDESIDTSQAVKLLKDVAFVK